MAAGVELQPESESNPPISNSNKKREGTARQANRRVRRGKDTRRKRLAHARSGTRLERFCWCIEEAEMLWAVVKMVSVVVWLRPLATVAVVGESEQDVATGSAEQENLTVPLYPPRG